jgi:hypothetical protein
MTARTIFLIIHVVCAGIWLSQFVVGVALERMANRAKGTAGESWTRLAQGNASSLMGQIGGIGILISGLALAGISQYGILGLFGNTPTWLFIKQVVYIVAMAITGALIIRRTPLIIPPILQAAAKGEAPSAASNAELQRVFTVSHVVNLLVLINIVLGFWRPT